LTLTDAITKPVTVKFGGVMLTPSAIHNAKGRKDGAYKLADERGMYLLVKPTCAARLRVPKPSGTNHLHRGA